MNALALQGGGCRAFFQLGVLATAGDALGPFDEIAAVSASTAMAAAHVVRLHAEALERFARRVRKNRRNFYPGALLRGRRLTPHLAMYRETVLECLSGEKFAELRRSPTALRFLVGVGPARSRALVLALAATAAITRRPAPLVAARAIDARALASPAALADAILASSAFPPFTPLPLVDGRFAIDGGVVESVPLSLLTAGARVTAILTRPTPWRPLPPSVRVIAPREPLPIAIWDYADEPRLRATWDAGRRVGESLLRDRDGREPCASC